ncbi:MAG: class I poly(R)-hydroxyalkanoic acid synthase [Rickettsiaceae bacterium]|nr:MAG: class I poly(R)-hydroxyalkanoic acid synthase [Rickettsiaceae bacterium]
MSTISTDEVISNIKKINDKYQEIVFLLMQGKGSFVPQALIDTAQAKEMILQSFNSFIEKPDKFVDLNIKYITQFKNLLTSSMDKFVGKEVGSIYTPNPKDRRFKDSNWQENVYFDFVKQFYIMTSKWTEDYIDQCNLEPKVKEYLEFQVKQFINACSPTNFIFSNPVVFKATIETGWQNIVQGLDNFLDDIKNSKDVLSITTTNTSHFKVGENIAVTPGKVVYKNELIELICYKPQAKVYTIPILIIPPWINKYYILDLSEQNSLVKFLINCNFQVFLISWINPDEKLAHKSFDNYLQEGILESYNYLADKLGYNRINAMGYCIGGTLLALAMAYTKQTNLDIFNSASFLTTLLDFSDPGELGIFINDLSISAIEIEMESKGYFDGKYLSNSFSLLKANDLIWSFFVNNYLLGKKPLAFDILFWNSDSTNLPAKMHSFYLRNMYLNNLLKIPGGIKILDEAIDLSIISVPTFFLATEEDHISPWPSVYRGLKLLNGEKTFCLAGSGHVAGVINPPQFEKYSYRISQEIELSHDQWLLKSKELKGSWWIEWENWLRIHSDRLEKSIDYDNLDYIEFAPGSYVK